MMTSTQYQALKEWNNAVRNVVFGLLVFVLVVALAAFFIVVPRYIPVATPDPLPAPEYWPEENPCPTPPQPYFDQ
jgi:hypothetical protein